MKAETKNNFSLNNFSLNRVLFHKQNLIRNSLSCIVGRRALKTITVHSITNNYVDAEIAQGKVNQLHEISRYVYGYNKLLV